MKTKTAKKKLNVRLLRKVQKHILAEPKRLMMAWWRFGPDQDHVRKHIPPCGTIACIAGWAVLLGAKKPEKVHTTADEARKLLNIGTSESQRLFAEYYWPDEFKDRWHGEGAFADRRDLLSPKEIRENAKTASDRIDRFIETKGAE